MHAVFLSLSKKEHPLDKICSIRRTIVKKHCDSKYILNSSDKGYKKNYSIGNLIIRKISRKLSPINLTRH